MKLRKEAKGRGCMVRIPEVCNHNSETTVLAHYRLAGVSGIDMKSPDVLGAWACSACHDAIDRRAHTDPVKAEREACAKLCDQEVDELAYGNDDWYIAKTLAAIIRARGEV
jgi:hypothetical protein